MTPRCSECRRQAVVVVIAAKGPPGVPLPFCARHALLHIQWHTKDDDLRWVQEKAGNAALHMKGIDSRLDLMLPEGRPHWQWGGAEAFELQALLLLELRYSRGSTTDFTLHYEEFLTSRQPASNGNHIRYNQPLSARTQDHALIARELRAFRDHLRETTETT